MPREDQELLEHCEYLTSERRLLARYGELLAENQIPNSLPRTNAPPDTPEAKAAIETIRERYRAAYGAARGAWAEETRQQLIARNPIDDAAWAEELERRRRRDEQMHADWERT